MREFETFKYGATWIRADFHLHTKADKEFSYKGENFIQDYIERLKSAGIQIGVITNHNKFEYNEFKQLKKHALKEEILLLPGVELSVNDGANGIHTLIVFGNEWVDNTNHISSFLSTLFLGMSETEYQNENARCKGNVLQVVEDLEKTNRDYFIIFAHVEQKSGLWYEMSGGKLSDFATSRYSTVRERTLGFQKVRTYDKPNDKDKPCRAKVKDWLQQWYPAEVEGSDPKSIEEIGKGKEKTYLKIGAFSFNALKLALSDYKNRVRTEEVQYKHSYIQSIKFVGGKLDTKEIHFSPELNTLIGIRGSGKSSVLEVLRDALTIPFGDNSLDKDYKKQLVNYVMESGGKVEIQISSRDNQLYSIRKVLNERPDVYFNNELQPYGISILETILKKPLYFGQKDLSNSGKGFEKDLIERILSTKLIGVRENINLQKLNLAESVADLLKNKNYAHALEEQKIKLTDIEHKLKIFEKYKLEDKLQKRTEFDRDERTFNSGKEIIAKFFRSLNDLISEFEDEFLEFKKYSSPNNKAIFEELFSIFNEQVDVLKNVNEHLNKKEFYLEQLQNINESLSKTRRSMVEEFAEIEREVMKNIEADQHSTINFESFRNLQQDLENTQKLIREYERYISQKESKQHIVNSEISKLNDLWLEEFNIIQDQLTQLNNNDNSLKINVHYKGDKESFLKFLISIFRGTGIRNSTMENIANKYTDCKEIFYDLSYTNTFLGSNPQVFIERFNENLDSLLTYQVPNKYVITYQNKEIQQHSLGQRASALMLFILSQNENDVIIIDQPEDDLDNQTIYEDVITLMRTVKPSVQFIFATHNPNIPVLGDAEMVHACSNINSSAEIHSAGIDDSETQKNIVQIMEGGKEAFERRKEIYNIWKP